VRLNGPNICRTLLDSTIHLLCCPTRPDFNFIQIFAACSSSFYSITFHGFCTTQLLLTVLPAGVCELHVKMESLSDTLWDVVISGTGLQQSLLAL
jgi:hypothetical protein